MTREKLQMHWHRRCCSWQRWKPVSLHLRVSLFLRSAMQSSQEVGAGQLSDACQPTDVFWMWSLKPSSALG